MKAVGIIPARLHSTRFPRKILHLINGIPMVVHVYNQARKAKSLSDVIVAIDDVETEDVLKSLNVKNIMTAKKHASGTDRAAEAAKDMDADIIVNIQGDEPFLDPNMIDELVSALAGGKVEMATAASTILEPADVYNSNVVKVLLNRQGRARSFSRKPQLETLGGYYRHIGIYAFKKEKMMEFAALPPSHNEKYYKLEQLRALDNGIPIKVVLTRYPYKGVDSIEDLQQFKGNHDSL